MSADPHIGQVIAGHRVESLLGQGGMSVVYIAKHVRLGRTRALKLLSSTMAQDPDARMRFEEEWKLAASIEHPRIVEVYDAGEFEGQLYIIMRYVQGVDLKGLVERDGPLEPGRAVALVEQAAEALDAAHSIGLVHRDVKPANILVDSQERAYLSDFGIAKFSESPQGGLTQEGLFIGTIDYAAPEQIEDKALDARTDVYALGGVLYYCLTGEAPYVKATEPQVMLAHVLEPPPLATAKRAELPKELDAVIARAMAKTKEERYASCGELVADIRAQLPETALEGTPGAHGTAAARPSLTRPATPSAPGDGGPALTKQAVTPPPLGGPALTKPTEGDALAAAAGTSAAHPPDPPSRSRFLLGSMGGLAGFALLVGVGALVWFLVLGPGDDTPPPPADRTSPALAAATARSADTIALDYDEAIDPSSVPHGSAFEIRVDNATARGAAPGVAVSGRTVTLRLPSELDAGRTTIAYTRPETNPLRDRAGNLAPGFVDRAVDRRGGPPPDVTQPSLLRAALTAPNVIVITYNEALNESLVPPGTAFVARAAGHTGRFVVEVGVSGAAVTLTLLEPLPPGRVSVDYNSVAAGDSGIRDRAGNPADSFSRFFVERPGSDSRGETTAPRIVSAVARDGVLRITYDERLDPHSTPRPLQFTVKTRGEARGVPLDVRLQGRHLVLTLRSVLRTGAEPVALAYRRGGGHPLRDLAGNPATAFEARAIDNRTFTPGDLTGNLRVCGGYSSGRCASEGFTRRASGRYFILAFEAKNVKALARVRFTFRDLTTGRFIGNVALPPQPPTSRPQHAFLSVICPGTCGSGDTFEPGRVEINLVLNGNPLQWRAGRPPVVTFQ